MSGEVQDESWTEWRVGDVVEHPELGLGTFVGGWEGVARVSFPSGEREFREAESCQFIPTARPHVWKWLPGDKWARYSRVLELICTLDLEGAERYFQDSCAQWWERADYEVVVAAAAAPALWRRVLGLLERGEFTAAEELYRSKCAERIAAELFAARKAETQFNLRFQQVARDGALHELDALFRELGHLFSLTLEQFVERKRPVVRDRLSQLGITDLDADQLAVVCRPESRLLVCARAGSGKTRTLAARAALAIEDEGLQPNQVMVLAFNTKVADEIRAKVQKNIGHGGYLNARTFHSLAAKLARPPDRTRLLGSDRKQLNFVERVMRRVWSEEFEGLAYQFFRREFDEIERLGAHLPEDEYFVFRRSLQHVTLDGTFVKSKGEKYIADWLFEHGVNYYYEDLTYWNTDCEPQGHPYRPDFTFIWGGRRYFLEHWALDPADPFAELPTEWTQTADQYRQQIAAKRRFWKQRSEQKGVIFLETHAGMLRGSREHFEAQLAALLRSVGVDPKPLPEDVVRKRVLENPLQHSRMARLFLQFIQRAKRKGWSAENVRALLKKKPLKDQKLSAFYEMALVMLREYTAELNRTRQIDFDDLLLIAADCVKRNGDTSLIHLGDGASICIRDLRWILLDEYQDFSELYYRLLASILEVNPRIRLMAVGDDWQAINGFAGAELRFFHEFERYFPGSHVCGLPINRRSARGIVAAGNAIMAGRGEPSRAYRPESAIIRIEFLRDTPLRFPNSERAGEAQEGDDDIYLPTLPAGRSWYTDREQNLARALKACARIIVDAPLQETLVLSRTNRVYGEDLNAFVEKLVSIVAQNMTADRHPIAEKIKGMTVHKSKGHEADTVIVLDVTLGAIPLVHPDNALLNIFGVTSQSVLDDERRLFYVAITRAKDRLFLLTERGNESPFLRWINERGAAAAECVEVTDWSHVPADLC